MSYNFDIKGSSNLKQISGDVKSFADSLKSAASEAKGAGSSFKGGASGVQAFGSAIKPIPSTAQQMNSSLSNMGKSLDQTGSGFKTSGSSAQQFSSAIKPIPSTAQSMNGALANIGKSLTETGAGFKEGGTAAGQFDTAIKPIPDTANQMDGALANVGASLTETGAGFKESSTSAGEFDAAIQPIPGTTEEINSSLTGMSGTLQDTAGGLTEVASTSEGTNDALSNTSQATEGAASSFNDLVGELSPVAQEMGSAADSTGQMNDAMGRARQPIQGVSGEMKQLVVGLDGTKKSMDQTAQGTQKFGSNLTSLVGSFTAVIGSAVSLYQSFQQLERAQVAVDRATLNYNRTQLQIEGLQRKVNQLVAEGKTGTTEYAVATDKLALAQDKQAINAQKVEFAQENLNMQYAEFAQEIIPQGIALMGSLSAAYGAVQKDGESFTETLHGMADTALAAFGAMGKAAKSFGTALLSLQMHPLVIAIEAVVAVLLLFITNIGGARDAINGFGKALGDAIPGLKPLLDWLAQAGRGLTELAGTTSQSGGVIIDQFGNIQAASVENMQGSIQQFDEFGNAIGTTMPGEAKKGVDATIAELDKLILRLTSTFGPPVQATLTNMRKFFGDTITVSRESSAAIQELGLKSGQSLVYLNNAVAEGGKSFGELGNMLQVAQLDSTTFRIEMGTLNAIMKATGMTQQEVIQIFKDLGFQLQIITETSGVVVAGNKLLDVSFKGVSESTAKFTEYLDAVDKSLVKVGQNPMPENIRKMAMDLLEAGQATEKFSEAQEKAYDKLRTGIDTTADLNTRYEQFKQTLSSTTPGLYELGEGFNKPTEAMNIMSAVFDTLVPQLETGKTAADNLAVPFKNLAPTFIATANGIISMADGMNKIITPGQIIEGIFAKQQSTISSVNGLMATYTNGIQQAGISLSEYIDFLEQEGLITGEVAEAMRAKGEELGLITEKEKEELTVLQELVNANKELANTITETAAAMADGTMQTEMYNKGVLQQQKALQDQQLALDESRGMLDEYTRQVESGEAGNVAFTQGVLDQRKALLDSKVAISQVAGQIKEYVRQLTSGEQASVAFAEGQQKIQQELLDSIRNIADLQGQIDMYSRTVQDGTAQTIAFREGLETGRLAALQLQTDLAAANGEYQGFRENLLATNPELQKFGDLSGMTNEQIQKMAEAMAGGREAIAALTEELYTAAAAFTDWISGIDFSDIDDEFEDLVDKFRDGTDEMIRVAEDNGVQISDEFKAALDFEGTKQLAGKQMQDLWPTVAQAVKIGMKNADPSFIDQGVQIFTERVKKALEEADVPAAAKTVVDGILTELANLKNIKDPVELQAAMSNIKAKIDALAEGTDGLEETTTALTGLTNVKSGNLASLASGIGDLSASVDNLIKKQPQLAAYKKDLEGLAKVAPGTFKGIENMPTAGESAKGLAPGGQPIQAPSLVDTKPAIDSLTQLQNLTVSVVNRIKTELLRIGTEGIGQLVPYFTGLQTVFTNMQTFVTTTVTGINTSLLSIGTVGIGQLIPYFTGLQTVFTNMVTFVTTTVTQINAQFLTIGTVGIGQLLPFFTQLQAVFTNMVTFVTGVITQINTQFLRIGTEGIGQLLPYFEGLQTTFTNMQSFIAGVMDQIVQELYKIAEPGITQLYPALKALESAFTNFESFIAGIMSKVVSHIAKVKTAIDGIGTSADTAKGKVDALATAINNLKDKTVTITYRIVTIGSPPSGYQHGGSFITNQPTLFMAGEAHRKERIQVKPGISPFASELADKQRKSLQLSNMLSSLPKLRQQGGAGAGRDTGTMGRRATSGVVHEQPIEIVLMLPDKELTRVVKKVMWQETAAGYSTTS